MNVGVSRDTYKINEKFQIKITLTSSELAKLALFEEIRKNFYFKARSNDGEWKGNENGLDVFKREGNKIHVEIGPTEEHIMYFTAVAKGTKRDKFFSLYIFDHGNSIGLIRGLEIGKTDFFLKLYLSKIPMYSSREGCPIEKVSFLISPPTRSKTDRVPSIGR